jgi:Tfp pilus assembly ATPase PilU
MTGYESKRAMAQDKLAQPAQELVGFVDSKLNPIQRQPLTDEQIEDIAAKTMFPINFARAIEAAHGIKENT